MQMFIISAECNIFSYLKLSSYEKQQLSSTDFIDFLHPMTRSRLALDSMENYLTKLSHSIEVIVGVSLNWGRCRNMIISMTSLFLPPIGSLTQNRIAHTDWLK